MFVCVYVCLSIHHLSLSVSSHGKVQSLSSCIELLLTSFWHCKPLDSLMEVEPFGVSLWPRTMVHMVLAWRQACLPWMGTWGAQFTPGTPLRCLLGMDGAESPRLFGEVAARAHGSSGVAEW